LKNNHLNYQVALTLLEGIGPKNAKMLLSHMGNETNIFESKQNIKTTIPGLSKERFRKLNKSNALKEAEPIVEYIKKNKIDTTFFTHSEYSQRLKQCADSPILLYHKGDFDFNHPRPISIVGTRSMTRYGKQLINELLTTLKPFNIQVISGLALGVDGYAHRKCLELDIPTIGVLGHGLDYIYPAQHKSIASQMIQTKGCGIITEFPNGTLPDRMNFPQRNRIVAGLSMTTIVIESGDKGGSLITANLANDYNRDVFAFPGDVNRPFSKGCNNIIRSNTAHLITSGKDFISIMGWEEENKIKVRQMNLFDNLKGDDKLIANTIKDAGKISIDILSLKLKKPVHTLSSTLLKLEIEGIVMSLPGKNYSLAIL